MNIKNHYTKNSHKNHYTINYVIINQINKQKAKYMINACIPKLLFKKFSLFFFTGYKNGWK